MTKHTWYTITGGALIGACLLSVAGGLAHPIPDGESHSLAALTMPSFPYAHLLIYLGALLLMAGLPGAIVALAPRIGRIGTAGLILYFLTSAVVVQGGMIVEGFVVPALARDPAARHLVTHDAGLSGADLFTALQTVGGPLFLLSLLLIGIGLIRSAVVPRWIGALLVAGALALFAPLPELPVLTGLLIEGPRGLAVAAIGLLLIRTGRAVPASVAAGQLQEA